MSALRKFGHLLAGLTLSLTLIACGDDAVEEAALPEPAYDTQAAKEAYYRDNPDFFTRATMDDLPVDLVWEDGSDLPELGSPNAKKGGTWNEYLQDFPRTMRMVGPDSNGSFRSYILDYTRPYWAHPYPDDQTKYYPGVAEKWAVGPDKRTVFVKINPKAVFSDGEKITTDDVFFSFFFYHSKHIVAPWYNDYYKTYFVNVTRYDDEHFSLTMPEAKPDLVFRTLTWAPYPEHFFDEFGPDYVERYQWRFVPTTGPYTVKPEDIRKGRSVVLTRQKDWWGYESKFYRNRFNVDKIRLTVIRDQQKAFEAFRRGDLDRSPLNLAEQWYDKLPNEAPDVAGGYIHKSTFYNQHPRPTWGLWLNQSKPLLDNNDIRVGLNYAANWQKVIDQFFRGDYERMRSWATGYGAFSHPTLEARSFSVEKALEYFAKSGFTERGGDGILVNNEGVRLAFTLTCGSRRLADILTILREEAAKAGVDFRIELMDGTAAFKKLQEKKHDVYLGAFSTQLQMYPKYWEYYHSGNAYDDAFDDSGALRQDRVAKTQTNNVQMVASWEMDQRVGPYRLSDDKDEMIDLAHEMAQIVHDTASFIPGWVQPFYRTGHWRWVRYPESTFNQMHSRDDTEYHVHWIDEELKAETLAARKNGETFAPQINVYDQFRDKES